MFKYVVIFVSTAVLFACKGKSKEKKEPAQPSITTIDSAANANKDSVLTVLTKEVLAAFKNRNYDSLAMLIHPDSGLRFSPYAYINLKKDVVMDTAAIRKLTAGKQSKIVWGEYDGSGDGILMTFDEYLKAFIYGVDFIKPDTLKVNQFIGGGNTRNNLSEVYGSSDFTESHFAGFDKKVDGMDWQSLRLVFRLKEKKYYLVGVVHDSWTM